MKNLTITFILFLGVLTSLSAQKVDFSSNGTFGMSRGELKQAYLEGNIDPQLENSSKLNPMTNSRAYELRRTGYEHLENHRLDQAKIAFDDYLAMMPHDALAYYCLGDYYRACQDFRKASLYYQQAARLGMDDAQALANYALDDLRLHEIESEKVGWE